MRSRKLIISCKCFQALIQKHPNSRFGSWKLSFHVLISWDNQSCKCFQAHIQTCYNFLKRSWKYYDHTLRKKRFLCTVTTFLSTVWNAHGVQREPTQIFISWESRGSTDPISPIFVENNMRSACIIHVFKIQSCKVQIQNYPKCFVSGQGKLYYILRKSGAANVFRSRSKHHSTFFKYKMFKEMVMMI